MVMTNSLVPDPGALNTAIAAKIRGIMAERTPKVTQQDLIEATCWSRAKVNRLYNGKTEWGAADLIAVCDYLGVDLGAAKRVVREAEAAGEHAARRPQPDAAREVRIGESTEIPVEGLLRRRPSARTPRA